MLVLLLAPCRHAVGAAVAQPLSHHKTMMGGASRLLQPHQADLLLFCATVQVEALLLQARAQMQHLADSVSRAAMLLLEQGASVNCTNIDQLGAVTL
jgi:hypothetical protein